MIIVVGIIQVRMGSSRLPGKMMFSLDCEPVISHDIRRVSSAKTIDEVVVATSDKKQDNIIEEYTKKENVQIFRGSEKDVLGRMYNAAKKYNADIVVRITGDCPLIPPKCIDTVVNEVLNSNIDYCSNTIERTFPRGCDVEAFTLESFKQVEKKSQKSYQREHVTPYYRENPEKFKLKNITSEQVFNSKKLQDRTDLRLTLDEADDYKLLKKIYNNISYDYILDIEKAIKYIDKNNLSQINQNISQKSIEDASDNKS